MDTHGVLQRRRRHRIVEPGDPGIDQQAVEIGALKAGVLEREIDGLGSEADRTGMIEVFTHPGLSEPGEVARTHIGDTRALDGAAIKRLFDEMEAEGVTRLRASFDGPARATRSVDMRYGEQVFEIAVPLDDVDWTMPDPLAQIVERFHRRHEELYTYSSPDQETVLVNARVAVAGILSALPQEPCLPEAELARPRCQRQIWLDEWIAAAVWDFDALAPGQVVEGPAIIKSAMTTVLLRPGDRATITPLGWIDIALSPRH